MDKQQVEVLGRNHLVEELIRAGLEVALPVRDRGIDLIAYSDKEIKSFRSRPIQLKASSKSGFSIDKKYSKVVGIVIAFVWNLDSREETISYALTFQQLHDVADAMDYTKTPSWETGTYTVTNPGQKLVDHLAPFRTSSKRWWNLVVGANSDA